MWTICSAAAAALLLLLPTACHGEITSCEGLQAAFALTQTQDVVETISPAADIECATWTNMTMTSNSLTVGSSENLSTFFATTNLIRVRFEVTGGAQLTWETDVLIRGEEGEDQQNNDGGAVFVGEGSSVRFLNDVEMRDVRIINERDGDTDFAVFVRSGGCVHNSGSFIVDGECRFTRCDITGAGESPPGPGGALWNGVSGSVIFNGGVDVSETFLNDDFGNDGGALFNQGEINIFGNSRFQVLRARDGGAIWNGENAILNFEDGATAFFDNVGNDDGRGGALFNQGFIKFSGPALFVDADAPVIVAIDESWTILSENSAFWDVTGAGGEAISLADGADITIPDSVSFVGLDAPSV